MAGRRRSARRPLPAGGSSASARAAGRASGQGASRRRVGWRAADGRVLVEDAEGAVEPRVASLRRVLVAETLQRRRRRRRRSKHSLRGDVGHTLLCPRAVGLAYTAETAGFQSSFSFSLLSVAVAVVAVHELSLSAPRQGRGHAADIAVFYGSRAWWCIGCVDRASPAPDDGAKARSPTPGPALRRRPIRWQRVHWI